MITSITLQFTTNKNFLNPAVTEHHTAGKQYVADLEELLRTDTIFLGKMHNLVKELNTDLTITNIEEVMKKHLSEYNIRVHNHTKKKRTYSCAGLTIHEEDSAPLSDEG